MERLLTHQAAQMLGVTPATVRDMARRGVLRAVRVGHVRLFPRREVERLAAERAKREPQAAATTAR